MKIAGEAVSNIFTKRSSAIVAGYVTAGLRQRRGKQEEKQMFKKLESTCRSFLRGESGATAIEYGLIAGLIAVAIIAAVRLIGTDLVSNFTAITNSI